MHRAPLDVSLAQVARQAVVAVIAGKEHETAIDRCTIGGNARMSVAHAKRDAPCRPLLAVERNNCRGDGVNGHRISAQRTHTAFQPAVDPTPTDIPQRLARTLGDEIFRRVGHGHVTHADAQRTIVMQGHGAGGQLISIGNGRRVGHHLHIGIHVFIKHSARNDHLHAGTGDGVCHIPTQELIARAPRLGDGLWPTVHGEGIFGAVAEGILQHVDEAIVALLVDAHPAPTWHVAPRQAQAAAGKQIRLGIKGARALICVVVNPAVDGPVLVKGDAVGLAAEHLHTVHQQADGAHAIDVRRARHVIVCTDGHADGAPGFYPARQRLASLSPGKCLFCRAAVHHPLPRTGIEHHALREGATRVAQVRHVEGHRVDHLVRVRAPYFEVQMRTARRAGVAAEGNDVALAHAEKRAVWKEIDGEAFLTVLLPAHIACHCGGKGVKMAVDRRVTVGMRDIERIAIASGADRDARHVAVGHGMDGMSRRALRLDVQPPVEMIRAQLAEVGAQQHREIKGQAEAGLLLRVSQRGEEQKKCQ